MDGAGRAYVTGYTESSNFPTSPGAIDTTYNGDRDAFLTELNPAGSALVYSAYLGGTNADEGAGIAVDGAFVTKVGGPSGPTAICNDGSLTPQNAPAGYNVVLGTEGGDALLSGTAGNDVIFGLGGLDKINGLGGDDIIVGGTGDDQRFGADGHDVLCGGRERLPGGGHR